MNKLSWTERLNAISINPDMATREDISRMATDLIESKQGGGKMNLKDLKRYEPKRTDTGMLPWREGRYFLVSDVEEAVKAEITINEMLNKLGDNFRGFWKNYELIPGTNEVKKGYSVTFTRGTVMVETPICINPIDAINFAIEHTGE